MFLWILFGVVLDPVAYSFIGTELLPKRLLEFLLLTARVAGPLGILFYKD